MLKFIYNMKGDKPMDFTRNEYKIIGKLFEKGCISKLQSFRIQKIADETNLSVPKIRQTLKLFLNLEIVDKGAKDERADTYFLTEKGIKIAEESMTVDKNILEKINKLKGV